MFNSGLTQPERALRNLLRFWIVAFFGAGLWFALSPETVVATLNAAGRLVHWPGPELMPLTNHLWHVLAISLMGLLVAMASRAIKELGRSLFLVRLIMLAKVISGAGFALALVAGERCFAYAGGTIVDFGIAGITYYFYRHVVGLKGTM